MPFDTGNPLALTPGLIPLASPLCKDWGLVSIGAPRRLETEAKTTNEVVVTSPRLLQGEEGGNRHCLPRIQASSSGFQHLRRRGISVVLDL